MRIATMSRQILEELRTRPLDAAGLNRLRAIDNKIIGELLTDLDPDLRQELQRLVQPLTCHTELSDAELRLAYAQLVGWLEGHLPLPRAPCPIRTRSWPQMALSRPAMSPPHVITFVDRMSNARASHRFRPTSMQPPRTIQRSGKHAKR
jgi:Protein of unknown function (DUF2587)